MLQRASSNIERATQGLNARLDGEIFRRAAAAGLPAIGPGHNAIPEIIRHGETGLLVTPNDGTALEEAIRSLFASAPLRRRLGARAREVNEVTTNPQAYMARLTEIINAARMR
ncbi:MAG TPA: glycosyltransferase [Vicinamibacterales bacterium]|nr:glycosyltransferase [Vicinamibacterales bacterium]